MKRKFLELTSQEQTQFSNLMSFMQKDGNMTAQFGLIERFCLDPADPVVLDFLMGKARPVQFATHDGSDYQDVEVLKPTSPLPPIQSMDETALLPVTVPSKSVEKSHKKSSMADGREMTYAHSEDLIIIQNRLLHAISNLTLNERRLILFLSPIVRKQIETTPDNRTFYVHVQDFVNEYDIQSKKYYSELEKIADSIVEKAFFFWYKTKNGKAKKGVSWVSECDYIKKEGKIKIKLDDTVIEMLTVFDRATGNYWTQYQKEWIINLGTYGIIMLELLLSSKENHGYYTIEYLRAKFDCIETYKKFSDFKLHVIDRAIKEIHIHTPIRVKYEQHKTGRAVTGVTFSYTNKNAKSIKDNTKDDGKSKENALFANFKMTSKQLAVFGSKIAKLMDKDIEIIADELCNVHLQSQYITILKALEFVPSDYYTDDEIKTHLTQEQLDELRQNAQKEQEQQAKLEQIQLQQDFKKLLHFAEEFVLANQKMVSSGIGKTYLKEKNYQQIVMLWEMRLLDKESRADFKMVDELLARDVP